MADDQPNNHNIEAEEEAAKIKTDLEEALSGWKRTAADFENYKRRSEESQKDLVLFARQSSVAKLLPVLDSLAQALKHMPDLENQPAGQSFGESCKAWQAGIGGILENLDKVFSDLGIKKIEAVGKKFDPHLHEAVKEEESEEEDGTITRELLRGYEIEGRIIRPSQVVIARQNLKKGTI